MYFSSNSKFKYILLMGKIYKSVFNSPACMRNSKMFLEQKLRLVKVICARTWNSLKYKGDSVKQMQLTLTSISQIFLAFLKESKNCSSRCCVVPKRSAAKTFNSLKCEEVSVRQIKGKVKSVFQFYPVYVGQSTITKSIEFESIHGQSKYKINVFQIQTVL